MSALELDKLTWPQVEAELEAGRDTVVVALGATEQHGLHMPLAGAVGDPTKASAEHGRLYWQVAVDAAIEQLESA